MGLTQGVLDSRSREEAVLSECYRRDLFQVADSLRTRSESYFLSWGETCCGKGPMYCLACRLVSLWPNHLPKGTTQRYGGGGSVPDPVSRVRVPRR